jgi:hypothetical protein
MPFCTVKLMMAACMIEQFRPGEAKACHTVNQEVFEFLFWGVDK